MTTAEIQSFDYIQIAKDLVVIICPVIGSVVAIFGLRTWNRQLKGSAEYELSRKILRAIYKYRNSIQGVRNPTIWINEKPFPDGNHDNLNRDQIRFFGISGAYQKRWDKVNEARADFLTELIEVEVIWGKIYDPLFQRLYSLERELQAYLSAYLIIIDPDSSIELKRDYQAINSERRDVLYSRTDESKDEFARNFNLVVTEIENAIRPKLGSHRKTVFSKAFKAILILTVILAFTVFGFQVFMRQLDIDRCLDNGGMYNYVEHRCMNK